VGNSFEVLNRTLVGGEAAQSTLRASVGGILLAKEPQRLVQPIGNNLDALQIGARDTRMNLSFPISFIY
jgi:hypothetical protein